MQSNADWGQKVPKDMAELAESERAKMADPFRAWVLKKRQELEVKTGRLRHHLRECEPFASAALPECQMEEMHNPAPEGVTHEVVVPAVVWEYASTSLQLAREEARLRLYNVYFLQAAEPWADVMLNISEATEEVVRSLWTEYMAEQE